MKCNRCGKEFELEDLYYDPYSETRYCDKCWKKYKKERYAVRKEENEALMEELIALRHMEEEDEEYEEDGE